MQRHWGGKSLKGSKSHQERMDKKSKKYIYVLKLEGRYYIGQSTDPESSIKKQYDRKGQLNWFYLIS